MLKRLINKIMKIKYVDSEGVERYETYKEWQERITKEVREITEDVDKYIEEGQFAPGSMLPKVEACKKFVLSGDKKVAIIASLTNAKAALRGESGTKIVK